MVQTAGIASEQLDLITGDRAGSIRASIESAIQAAKLLPGAPLPPVRRLAKHLGVSPTTVASAYRDLQARGLVTASGRRGTRVAPPPSRSSPPLVTVADGVRDLTHGNPDLALLPDLERAWASVRPEQQLYGQPASDRVLLELAAAEFRAEGVSPDFLLVVGGALDGIERTLLAHLHPGDRVALEDPGYPAIHDLLLALGLVPEPVAMDGSGCLPEALKEVLRSPLAAVIVTPRAQNPTGAALDQERAARLGALLRQHPDILLIEDDHAGPVAGTPLASICTEPPERWALVRSVSKSLGPDLRLAVMAGDQTTISKVEGRQRLGAGWVSHLLQGLVVALQRDASVQRLLVTAANAYSERRRALIEALAEREIAAYGRSGFNVWVPVHDEQAALRALLSAGWAVSPGERFRRRSRPGIRISIGGLLPTEAPLLAEALSLSADRPARTRSA